MATFAPVIRNVTFLLSLTFMYSLLLPYLARRRPSEQAIITGMLFGAFAIITMSDPIHLISGGIVDARHVIVMVSTMLTGWLGGLISTIIASFYRGYLGNPGAIPGISTIVAAYVIGLIYNRLTGKGVQFNWGIPLAGFAVAVTLPIGMASMSDGVGFADIPTVGVAVMIIYPIAASLLTELLSRNRHRLELIDAVYQFEQRQDAAFQFTPTLLMGVGTDGRILNVNPAMEAFVGESHTSSSVQHMDTYLATTPMDVRNAFRRLFAQALEGETVRELIEVYGEHAALPASYDTYFIPISDSNGRVSMILVQSSNITRELEVKQKQVELTYARQRNAILEQLISDASHHLRTPLTIMNSSVYLIQKLTDRLPHHAEIHAALARHFDKHTNAVEQLDGIISDLLHLMRINHTSETRFEDINLTEFMRSTLSRYTSVADKQSKTFVFRLPSREINAHIVPAAIQHALENLIENSFRYTPEGGSISVEMTTEESTGDAVITVQDTGIGIPKEAQAKIFERFYRADNAEVHNSEGTGLGLAIVKETLDAHGGKIRVESEVNAGTTFTICLPLAAKVE